MEWRREGERDLFHGEGAVDFDLNKGSKRGLTGAGLTGTLGEDSSWVVVGKVSYALNENIGGELELTMDETMDPELIGRLDAKGDLIEGKELFAKKFTLGKISQEFGWGYILGGARLELSLDMLPLTMQGNFEVGPWRPVSAANDVPDFDAGLDLT